jgi:UDP-N-acetylmuramyl tripeptide synthase
MDHALQTTCVPGGKGHEDYQIFGYESIIWTSGTVIAAHLANTGKNS